MRRYHRAGDPHLGVKACYDEVMRREESGEALAHDCVKTRGTPDDEAWERALASDRAAAAAARLAEVEANALDAAPTISSVFNQMQQVLHTMGDGDYFGDARARLNECLGLRAALEPLDGDAQGVQVQERRAPGRHEQSVEFVGGETGDAVVNLVQLLRFIDVAEPREIFKIKALVEPVDHEELRPETVEVAVVGPTLEEVLAPWSERVLSGVAASVALTRDTALVMAIAPDEMRYLPPRRDAASNDFFASFSRRDIGFFCRRDDLWFWSKNQRAWIEVLLLDEAIFRVDPKLVLHITGDKPKTDCVLAPAGSDVRQDRRASLLDPQRLLGVGLKGSHAGSRVAAWSKRCYMLEEIEELGRGEIVMVFAELANDDQGLPKFMARSRAGLRGVFVRRRGPVLGRAS